MSPSTKAMLVLTAILAPLLLPAARAAESYDGCAGFIDALPATIGEQGVWCLRKDVSTAMSSGAAITVATNNVTIDCNHFKIGGLAAGDGSLTRGIRSQYRQNLTVRNCAIRGFNTGIDLSGGGGHVVEDNRVDDSLVTGIRVDATEGALVRRNRVLDTGGFPDNGERHAIYCYAMAGRACDLRDNLVAGVAGTTGHYNTVTGLRVYGGTGGRVAGNDVAGLAPTGGNSARGIYASNHGPMFLRDNKVQLSADVADSVGIRCAAGAGAIRGNTAWGFATAYAGGCLGDGGNVAH